MTLLSSVLSVLCDGGLHVCYVMLLVLVFMTKHPFSCGLPHLSLFLLRRQFGSVDEKCDVRSLIGDSSLVVTSDSAGNQDVNVDRVDLRLVSYRR